MVENISTPQFPLNVTFSLGNWTEVFSSVEDIKTWIENERNGWNRYVNTGFDQGIRDNITNLENHDLHIEQPTEKLQRSLNKLATTYLPFKSIAGILKTFNETSEQQAIGQLISEIIRPGTLQWNHQFSGLKALANLFRLYGNPSDYQKSISQSQATATNIEANYKTQYQQFSELLESSKKKLEDFHRSFTEQVALQAPRTYWDSRAKEHAKAAILGKRRWELSLITLGYVMAILLGFSIWGKLPDTKDNWVLSIERYFIACTLLSLSLWWIRQKLNEVRSHEHLADDAAERVTMIDTYNALRQAGLQDADLTPILNALYKQTTRGMLKDEGPSLPIEVVLKTIADKKPN